MKKVFLFCALLAGVAMMTGCQKEQDGVTLKAVINQDTKAYIGTIGTDLYPFWNTDDKVKINGTQYGFQANSVNQTYATIAGVQGSAPYYAIYPSELATTMNLQNGTAGVSVRTHQIYDERDGHQRLEMLMAAKTEGTVLQFDNLCSILKVHVKNQMESRESFGVERIVVIVDGAMVSGEANYDFNTNTMTMNASSDNDVDYVFLTGQSTNAMKTLEYGQEHDFYLVMAPFSNKHVMIRVETTTHSHFYYEIGTATATASHMASVVLNVNNLNNDSQDAFLKPGPEVNSKLHDLLDGFSGTMPLTFRRLTPNQPANSVRIDLGEGLSTPIYAFVDGNNNDQQLIIQTEAQYIYLNANCRGLFANLTGITQVSFDSYIISDGVTDMSYMFANNSTLKISGLWALHTSNVTTMAYMFYHYTAPAYGGLDLQTFNTSSLTGTGMVSMFEGCTNLPSINMLLFDTRNVTSMVNVFKDCKNMAELRINNFDMGNVTDKSGMCSGLGEYRNPNNDGNNMCEIWCHNDVIRAMSSGTGIDLNKVHFNDITVSK